MNKDKALDLALEALKYWAVRDEFNKQTSEAITAIKQARSAPVQEPVGQVGWAANVPKTIREVHWTDVCPPIGTKLYTTPPAAQRQWVGLTQQDIDIAFDDTQEGGGFDDFARAIEAKLKEKNT
jgi:hypothetical protein